MLSKWLPQSEDIPDTLMVGRHKLPLCIRRNKRAKRICLRYNPTQHQIDLTLPQRTRIESGLDFIEQKSDWLHCTLSRLPRRIKLQNGALVSILGIPTTIDYQVGRPYSHDLTGNTLTIVGPSKQRSAHIEKALRKIIKDEIIELAHEKAQTIRRRVGRISVRDTRSRWGSCSETGNLSFSWRLVFAPYEVFDYVVSHEVAHLRHMNHSDRFWDTVERICPDYEDYMYWLDDNGQQVYRYIS